MKASLKQGKQILDLLSEHSTEEVQQLIGAGDLLKLMMQADLSRVDRTAFATFLAPPKPTHEQLFRSPEQVFEAFKSWNRDRGYAGLECFTDEQVDELHSKMPVNFTSKLDSVLSLRIHLRGSLADNVKAHWNWIQTVHERSEKWDYVELDDEHLRLQGGQLYDVNQSSVEWVIVDLTANRRKAPASVRGSQSAGFEVMAIFAVHPDLPPAINYEDIPGFWLAAFEVTVPGNRPWRLVLYLYWSVDTRKVWLHASLDYYASPGLSVPEFRELQL